MSIIKTAVKFIAIYNKNIKYIYSYNTSNRGVCQGGYELLWLGEEELLA